MCEGAASLSHAGNHLAASLLLRSAVRADPSSLVAHRRLAAALANAGDKDAAADEYSRFIEICLSRNDLKRAALELAYGQTVLGDPPQLRRTAASVVRLSDLARLADSPGHESGRAPVPNLHMRSAFGPRRPSRPGSTGLVPSGFLVRLIAASIGIIFTFATLAIAEVR